MKFSQRVKLSDLYRKWLREESKKHPYKDIEEEGS
jgi:hypothetical protein